VALLLDNVATPFNVGAIVRTAAALRVDHLWLAGATASPTHVRARKTALGSERYVSWTVVEDGAGAVAAATADGYRVVGLELAEGATPLHQASLSGDVCLALGHEDRGLTAACLKACDEVAFVPQLGRIGSLNVATAAAIALYEVRRRAWEAEP
jgi:tRNA (guanosine-2'-O-)-methyltransferase